MKDSLDGCLESNYDHAKLVFGSKNCTFENSPKNQMCGRTPKLLAKKSDEKAKLALENKQAAPRAPSARHSLRNLAQVDHAPTTHNGFSRKLDGGFYRP